MGNGLSAAGGPMASTYGWLVLASVLVALALQGLLAAWAAAYARAAPVGGAARAEQWPGPAVWVGFQRLGISWVAPALGYYWVHLQGLGPLLCWGGAVVVFVVGAGLGVLGGRRGQQGLRIPAAGLVRRWIRLLGRWRIARPIPSLLPEGQRQQDALAEAIAEAPDDASPAEEKALLTALITLNEKMAGEMACPLEQAATLRWEASTAEVMAELGRARYSRLPVLDATGETRGVLYAKDLLKLLGQATAEGYAWRGCIRVAHRLPAHYGLGRVLAELREKRLHIAFVTEPGGRVAGLITLQDILDELFGRINALEEEAATEVERMPDGSWLVHGSWEADRLADQLPDAELAEALRTLPAHEPLRELFTGSSIKTGAHLQLGRLALVAEAIRRRQVSWLRVYLQPSAARTESI